MCFPLRSGAMRDHVIMRISHPLATACRPVIYSNWFEVSPWLAERLLSRSPHRPIGDDDQTVQGWAAVMQAGSWQSRLGDPILVARGGRCRTRRSPPPEVRRPVRHHAAVPHRVHDMGLVPPHPPTGDVYRPAKWGGITRLSPPDKIAQPLPAERAQETGSAAAACHDVANPAAIAWVTHGVSAATSLRRVCTESA
jgi:hypothetical protein